MAGDPEPEDRGNREPLEEEGGGEERDHAHRHRDEPGPKRRTLALADRRRGCVREAEGRRRGEERRDTHAEPAVGDRLVDDRDGKPECEGRRDVALVELDRLRDDLSDGARRRGSGGGVGSRCDGYLGRATREP